MINLLLQTTPQFSFPNLKQQQINLKVQKIKASLIKNAIIEEQYHCPHNSLNISINIEKYNSLKKQKYLDTTSISNIHKLYTHIEIYKQSAKQRTHHQINTETEPSLTITDYLETLKRERKRVLKEKRKEKSESSQSPPKANLKSMNRTIPKRSTLSCNKMDHINSCKDSNLLNYNNSDREGVVGSLNLKGQRIMNEGMVKLMEKIKDYRKETKIVEYAEGETESLSQKQINLREQQNLLKTAMDGENPEQFRPIGNVVGRKKNVSAHNIDSLLRHYDEIPIKLLEQSNRADGKRKTIRYNQSKTCIGFEDEKYKKKNENKELIIEMYEIQTKKPSKKTSLNKVDKKQQYFSSLRKEITMEPELLSSNNDHPLNEQKQSPMQRYFKIHKKKKVLVQGSSPISTLKLLLGSKKLMCSHNYLGE